jgi:hypothetical protein
MFANAEDIKAAPIGEAPFLRLKKVGMRTAARLEANNGRNKS